MENRTAETLNAIEREKLVQLQILTSALEAKYNQRNIRREIATQFMAAMMANGRIDSTRIATIAVEATDILLEKLEQR